MHASLNRASAAFRTMMRAGFAATLTIAPATAQDFTPRPTRPYECGSTPPRAEVWSGTFSGRKEVNRSFFQFETTRQTACFTSARDCENWLYNLKSEYPDFTIPGAGCQAGLPR